LTRETASALHPSSTAASLVGWDEVEDARAFLLS
jgi:hypothetical protein